MKRTYQINPFNGKDWVTQLGRHIIYGKNCQALKKATTADAVFICAMRLLLGGGTRAALIHVALFAGHSVRQSLASYAFTTYSVLIAKSSNAVKNGCGCLTVPA